METAVANRPELFHSDPWIHGGRRDQRLPFRSPTPLGCAWVQHQVVVVLDGGHAVDFLCPTGVLPPTTSISSCRWGESLTHANAGRPVCRADYPRLVDTQTDIFGLLLDESVGYDKFALEMRKAKVARKYVVETGKMNDKD